MVECYVKIENRKLHLWKKLTVDKLIINKCVTKSRTFLFEYVIFKYKAVMGALFCYIDIYNKGCFDRAPNLY